MQAITTVGLDIAKSVFQVHGIDAEDRVITRRQLKRRFVLTFFEKLPPCLVGIEACASSHYWSRELSALGHTVQLMPPAAVKPYVKRQKNDAADAEASAKQSSEPTCGSSPLRPLPGRGVGGACGDCAIAISIGPWCGRLASQTSPRPAATGQLTGGI